MRKITLILNILLLLITLSAAIYYSQEGGTMMKGLTSLGFVLIGGVNLAAASPASRPGGYVLIMATGLLLGMAADVALNLEYILGMALFMLGHICYIWAFHKRFPLRRKDLIFSGILFLGCLLLLLLYPFRFASPLMQMMCILYSLIISLMLGKALSNHLQEKSIHSLLLFLGSFLFFFSDLMLVFAHFGGASALVGDICILTYYPAQCLIAHSLYYSRKIVRPQ